MRNYTFRYEPDFETELDKICESLNLNTRNKMIYHVLSTYRQNQRLIVDLRQEIANQEAKNREFNRQLQSLKSAYATINDFVLQS